MSTSRFYKTRSFMLAENQSQKSPNNGLLLPQKYSLDSFKPTQEAIKEVCAYPEPRLATKFSILGTSLFGDVEQQNAIQAPIT